MASKAILLGYLGSTIEKKLKEEAYGKDDN